MDAVELTRLGVKSGDRIAACLPTGPELVELLLAALQIGAIFCPLNNKLPLSALQKQVEKLAPKLLFTPSGYEHYSTHAAPLKPASLLLFTSGSTSEPKMVSLSLAALKANAQSAACVCDLRPGDRWLLSLPMHHVAGIGILFRSEAAHAQVTFDPSDREITHLSQVPAQLYQAWPVYPKLRCLLLGGGPIHEVPKELPCLVSYSMTETASIILAGKSPDRLWPAPGKEVKLADDGEILVRADSMFDGYWNGDTLESPLSPDGWFATKDLGRFDPTRGFSIVGRKDNQFISGGENIQPEEIERALLTLPGVVEAIVVPRKHDRFGMRPIAFVRTISSEINAKSLHHQLADILPKYKIPDAFFPLPETSRNGIKRDRKIFLNDNQF